MFEPTDVVFSYTRAQAIQDGVLVDVSSQAAGAGFRVAVAVTAAVWAECVEWPKTEPAIQNESGRLWDVVFMAALAARRAARQGEVDRTAFELLVVPRGGQVPQLIKLVLHIGPGGQGEPVATLMLPGED